MRKRNTDFDEIDILKERYMLRIREQELKIKDGFSEITNNLTGVALLNNVKQNLFSGSGFAFKLGFMAFSLIRKKLAERRKKK